MYRATEEGQLKWQCVLKEHTQLVSAIDWNRDGSFASCSHDSSAYVWRQDGAAWKPELVGFQCFISRRGYALDLSIHLLSCAV